MSHPPTRQEPTEYFRAVLLKRPILELHQRDMIDNDGTEENLTLLFAVGPPEKDDKKLLDNLLVCVARLDSNDIVEVVEKVFMYDLIDKKTIEGPHIPAKLREQLSTKEHDELRHFSRDIVQSEQAGTHIPVGSTRYQTSGAANHASSTRISQRDVSDE
ncbi:hypothetical protein EK21DRAFT_116397 [Setomelanomma holmii]|uniref:Uncharacterized protein n=1 Tax=Setomelanomma holmii TaxID=210430 RepID=A0A9P4H1F2_9PLEO|nr:hypothetical protein EK21DRAFT_116397 [Setomelanomma holmii]